MTCQALHHTAIPSGRLGLDPLCSGEAVAVGHTVDDSCASMRTISVPLCETHARQLVCWLDSVEWPSERVIRTRYQTFHLADPALDYKLDEWWTEAR